MTNNPPIPYALVPSAGANRLYAEYFCSNRCLTLSQGGLSRDVGKGTNYDSSATCSYCHLPLVEASGAWLISQERLRQSVVHGWSADTDDFYTAGELVAAAMAYSQLGLCPPVNRQLEGIDFWPAAMSRIYDKRQPQDAQDKLDHTLRCLVKAGALLAAEIDRLQRVKRRLAERAEKVR